MSYSSNCSEKFWARNKDLLVTDNKVDNNEELTENEKKIKTSVDLLFPIESNRVKNVYYDKMYDNVLKDIELKYDLKENEPSLTTDFRKLQYNNRIARKAIVDHVKYNPLLQTAKYVYKDGTSFNLRKP